MVLHYAPHSTTGPVFRIVAAMQRFSCRIEENEAIASTYYRLRFSFPDKHDPPVPGQFLTIRPGDGVSPLLRRPFAFSRYDNSTASGEIIYERRGEATKILTGLGKDDSIDVISPLGVPFPEGDRSLIPILLAGGVGMGPMFMLSEAMRKAGREHVLLLGARSADRIPRVIPEGTIVCTDDGGLGFRGNLVQYLEQESSTGRIDPRAIELFACGPNPMMKAASRWLRNTGSSVPAWLSMEQTMGCAVGACMGCVVKVKQTKPYARVCTEGPVFPADLIDWD